ncbi:MAG: hypothetical protein JW876_08780 [Candidatus Krumholzibacteriota bacterium]|nr:hypothetical protein [Candidatus Krumholzibacteriota bacterium]
MDETVRTTCLCIFEDDRFPNFFPLTYDKPVFDLFIGTQILRDRFVAEIAPLRVALLCRPYLAPVLAERACGGEEGPETTVNGMAEEETVFLNGRILAYGEEMRALLDGLDTDTIRRKNGVPVVARLSGENALAFAEYLRPAIADEAVTRVMEEIKAPPGDDRDNKNEAGALEAWAAEHGVLLEETGQRLLSYYWQLIGENGACIVDDFRKIPLRGTDPESEVYRGVEMIREEDILIGSGVQVRSGTVLDASDGPIVIADDVNVEPNAIIHGPCFIGRGTIVRGGARIGHGTSIGEQCRIGGEVGESVVAPFSNKQHGGFLGHSYVGSWVNIGAGTSNSDLKNNYGKVRAWCAGHMRDTGRRFLGVVIGDHAKIAINTGIDTGTVIGFNTNVKVSGWPPKHIPSFMWYVSPEPGRFEIGKAIETARIMMDRRNVPFSAANDELFTAIHRFIRTSGHLA